MSSCSRAPDRARPRRGARVYQKAVGGSVGRAVTRGSRARARAHPPPPAEIEGIDAPLHRSSRFRLCGRGGETRSLEGGRRGQGAKREAAKGRSGEWHGGRLRVASSRAAAGGDFARRATSARDRSTNRATDGLLIDASPTSRARAARSAPSEIAARRRPSRLPLTESRVNPREHPSVCPRPLRIIRSAAWRASSSSTARI